MDYSNQVNHKPTPERLATIEAILERLEKELLGNGRPGFIQITNQWKDEVNRERSWIKGAFATISAIVSAIGIGGLVHIFRGK